MISCLRGKWNRVLFEILNYRRSSIKREDVKNHVESHFKEARHPMSAFSFIAIEKVSLGLGRGDLNFIRLEKERPFGSFPF